MTIPYAGPFDWAQSMAYSPFVFPPPWTSPYTPFFPPPVVKVIAYAAALSQMLVVFRNGSTQRYVATSSAPVWTTLSITRLGGDPTSYLNSLTTIP